jgi:hypothetical protein
MDGGASPGDLPTAPVGESPPSELPSDLPQVGISATPQPVNLTATITGITYREDTGEYVDYPFDLPDENAYPLETMSPPIPVDPLAGDACILDPESQRFLGTEVQLRLLVEADGSVSEAYPAESATHQASEAYLELAQCLVRSLLFQPALQGGEPVASDNLIVNMTVTSGASPQF